MSLKAKSPRARARLAIGFTSQYEAKRGRIHLGGTRGPMRRHILLREWSGRVSERERLELLLHELGHFLGATHSPEADSVMRPVLGDGKARRKAFAVRFDPINTLIIAMVGEEMRRRRVQSFFQLSPSTRRRLGEVYAVLGKAMPQDESTKHFQRISEVRVPTRRTGGSARGGPDATRSVVAAVTVAARRLAALPKNEQPTGDELTNLYVRAAAEAAAQAPAGSAPKSFLMGLAVALDDSVTLRKLPLTRNQVLKAESNDARKARLKVLGKPTIESRRDLAKHFFCSAALTATVGAASADQMGMMKEASDSQGGTGFSFADIAANRAGIRFAESVLAGRFPLKQLAESFSVRNFTPSIKGLPEGLAAAELLERFGGASDERFKSQLAEIDRRIDALPPYMVIEIEF